MQTWYAIDVKQLVGSSLKSFTLEYSMDGQNYLKIDSFTLSGHSVGTIATFYFKPVYALSIRLVVNEGNPNIRIELYYSSEEQSTKVMTQDTFISKTVATTIDGAEQGGLS